MFEGEDSDRALYVTEQVALWLENDMDTIRRAQSVLGENGIGVFVTFVRETVRRARPGTAAWYVAQELAPNDYNRVHWHEIASAMRDTN
jgi:hypothetical protein